jgi:protein TonB
LTKTIALLATLALLPACAKELPETKPRQLEGSPFHYPEDLWDAGIEGETQLRLFVTRAGSVDSVRVEKGSGYAAFDSAAAMGARDLRFDPARRGTDSIGVWVILPVQFDLPGDGAKAVRP